SRILRNLVTGNADPRLRADDVTVLTGYLEVVSVPAAQQQGQPAQPQAQPGPPGPPPEISELEAGTKVYRLYNAPDLNDYIEFDKSAILWIEQFDTDVDRLGTTMVWFKQDANVKRMSLEPAQLQLDFFQGRIADKFMSQTTMRE